MEWSSLHPRPHAALGVCGEGGGAAGTECSRLVWEQRRKEARWNGGRTRELRIRYHAQRERPARHDAAFCISTVIHDCMQYRKRKLRQQGTKRRFNSNCQKGVSVPFCMLRISSLSCCSITFFPFFFKDYVAF
jgi:hypothetical protein